MSDAQPPPIPASNPPPPPPAPSAGSSPRTAGLAIASLVCGIVSILGGAILVIPAILAIVLGHVSRSKIQKDPTLGGAGLGLAGCILGYVSLLLGLVMVALAAMAIPAFERVRSESVRQAMESDARQIVGAAQQYMLENGVEEVSFTVDPATGAVGGPLSDYLSQITRGIEVVDGVVEIDGTFSLQHPRVDDGAERVFRADGEEL